MFRPVDSIKNKSRNLQVPSSLLQMPDYFLKVKIQVNCVTIKLFRGEYLIDAGL